MNDEATNEYARQCSYAVGMLEGILQKVRMAYDDAARGKKSFGWGDVGDATHLAGQLRDIEDRLWSKGEYAPENVAATGQVVRVADGTVLFFNPRPRRANA